MGSRFMLDLLPGLLLLGLGLGAIGVAVNVAGVEQVDHTEHGMAWGLINTSARVGTALGLALLVTIATARTEALSECTQPANAAIVAGYQMAFGTAALIAAIGVLAVAVLFRQSDIRSDRSNRTFPPESAKRGWDQGRRQDDCAVDQ